MAALLALWLCFLYSTRVAGQSNLTVQITAQDTFLLSRPFNNTFDQPFVNTTQIPSKSAANRTLTAAHDASFIAYDQEFLKIIGESPKVKLLATSSLLNESFAFEGGIWVPGLNQVWFTAFLNPTPGYLSILDLNTSTVFQPNITGAALPNPNGGYYFDGKVYMTTFGDSPTTPAIVAIDPKTYHAEEIVNSYFDLPLNGPDDITVAVSRKTGDRCLFFTDFFLNEEGLRAGTFQGPPQMPYFVWRHTPSDKNFKPVIGPLEIQVPNVFESPPNHTFPSFAGIYQFDLRGEDRCTPTNKRLFAFARQGFANGIKIDDYGRVWTAEYEGVIVRDGTSGKVLGLFNAQDIILNNKENPVDVRDVAPLANFALAEDQLVMLAFNRIFGIKLAENIMSAERFKMQEKY